MFYREMIAILSQNRIEHINSLCEQKVYSCRPVPNLVVYKEISNL
jgi:hypothetical protein